MNVEAHQITRGLYVGSIPPAKLRRLGFDVVVLAAAEIQDLEPDVLTLRVPLVDTITPMEPHLLRQAIQVAQQVAYFRREGKTVLVTCAAGVNRSSFVAALSLVSTGWTPEGAMERIRAKRYPPVGMMPLSNMRFVSLVRLVGGRRRRGAFRGSA